MKLKNKLLTIGATLLLSCQYSPAHAQVVDNPLNAYGLELTLCGSIADFAEEVSNLRQYGAKYEDVVNGDIERRTASSTYIAELRNWMDSFSEKIIQKMI